MRYSDIYVSLLRYCSEILESLRVRGAAVEFLVLDSQPNLEKLPSGDNFYLMGLTHSVEEYHNYVYVNGFFGFKVIDDANLMRLETLYMDYIIHELIEKKKCIPIYKNPTGEIVGHLQFDGTFETTPPRINDAAIFKNIAFTLLTPQALNTSGNG